MKDKTKDKILNIVMEFFGIGVALFTVYIFQQISNIEFDFTQKLIFFFGVLIYNTISNKSKVS